jgi:predicted flap endonuclease-1-like 5' DNA nuclease
MKQREFGSFLAGFLITAAVVAWLYWLWQQRREVMPRPLIISSREPVVVSPKSTPTPDPDDLTVIKGVGPVFAARLNKAGIFTYAQLAAQTPEKVQFITQVTRWDPADWIARAAELAG